jgi:WD40 repeat protein
LARFVRHAGSSVTFVGYSPDGAHVVTAALDGRACILRGEGFGLQCELPHDAAVTHAAFSHDGKLLVTCGDDQHARIWDASSGQPVGRAIPHEQALREVHFIREAKQIVAVQADGSARVWEVSTGKPFSPPMAPDTQMYRALMREARSGGPPHFQSDFAGIELAPSLGRIIAAAAELPRTTSADIRRATRQVSYAALSGDGRVAVTIDAKGKCILWDAHYAAALCAPLDRENPVIAAAISPDARVLAAGSADGIVRFWSIIPDERPPDDLKSIAEVLSCRLVDDTVGLYPLSAADWRSSWQLARERHHGQFTWTTKASS